MSIFSRNTSKPTWPNFVNSLRDKWHEVPAGNERLTTKELDALPDKELLDLWTKVKSEATTGNAFPVRGWYHLLYKDILRGKKVMDVGSGFGIDGITFSRQGAKMTFVDIVESNLEILKRLCRLLDLKDVTFCYLENVESLNVLPRDYDVIWCQGSLINAPFDIVREEAQQLLNHLPVGGRWIELAYPRERWQRDGKMAFEKWGERTDGGAPWMEWYDLKKVEAMLTPAEFDVVLYFNFHNDEFNWFDLCRRR